MYFNKTLLCSHFNIQTRDAVVFSFENGLTTRHCQCYILITMHVLPAIIFSFITANEIIYDNYIFETN